MRLTHLCGVCDGILAAGGVFVARKNNGHHYFIRFKHARTVNVISGVVDIVFGRFDGVAHVFSRYR